MRSSRILLAALAAASVLLWSVLKFKYGGLGLFSDAELLLVLVASAGLIVGGAVLAASKAAFAGLSVGAAAVIGAAALYRVAQLAEGHAPAARMVLSVVVVGACALTVFSGLGDRRSRSPLHPEGISVGLALAAGLLLVGLTLPPSSADLSFADWNGLNSRAPFLTFSWLLQLAVLAGAFAIAAQSRSNWGRMVAAGAAVPVVLDILIGQTSSSGIAVLYVSKPHPVALVACLIVSGLVVASIVAAKEVVIDEFVGVPPPPGFSGYQGAAISSAPVWNQGVATKPAAAGYAGFGARFGAEIVDGLVGLLFILPGALVVTGARNGPGAGVGLVLEVAGVIALFVFYCSKVGRSGQSWGHKAMGISIVDAQSGQPIGAGRVFGRMLARLISGIPCYLGYLWMLWDPMSQTWHDKIIGTIVVKGAPASSGPMSAPPPIHSEAPPAPFVPQAAFPSAFVADANPARWAADPFGRFEHRYWSGQKWTDQVSTNGVAGIDPPLAVAVRQAPEPPPIAPPPAPSMFAPLAPAPTVDDLHDGRTITRDDLSTIRGAAKQISVTLDTGQTLVLAAPLVIGRDPIALSHLPTAGLLPLDDPNRSISKTHCVIGPNQTEVWVEDCASANGTVVIEADGRRIVVKPGSRIVTEPGSTIRFGDRWLRINA